MTLSIETRVELRDAHSIPQLGLGVYKTPADQTADVVRAALEIGYRHVDTAALYGNEAGVGEGIRRSGLPRDEVFVTSKVGNDDHGFDATLRAFDVSMAALEQDVLDLYLIHWPVPSRDLYVDTWRAIIRLRDEGRVRSIGVSNFHPHHIDRIVAETGEVPVLDQVELHPWLAQREVRRYDDANGIRTEAWSPLARGRAVDDPTLARIGVAHGVSATQVAIRWHLQLGNIVIPKSTHPQRLRENADVFGFALTDAELAAIDALDSGERTGRDPDGD